VRLLAAPAREPAAYGSTGASLVRAALVEQPQDGSGADGVRRPLAAGEAAVWEPGEEHASGTDTGLTAVVVQCRVPPLSSSGEAP
jgi:hypothetical protein